MWQSRLVRRRNRDVPNAGNVANPQGSPVDSLRTLSNSEQLCCLLAVIVAYRAVARALQVREEILDMSTENSVVAIYQTHKDADDAVKELQRSGVDMHKLSVVGKGYHTDEEVVGYYNTGDRMKYWGKWGGIWGGFWGLLFGSAFFAIPGLGAILVAGPLVAWIVGALEGAVVIGGLSALGAGLYSMGIPKDSIVKYEAALKTDQFLLIAHGTDAEVARARDIIATTHPLSHSRHGNEAVVAA